MSQHQQTKQPSTSLHAATTAVRAALESDTQHGAVVPPLYLSSTFSFAGYDQKRPYDYTRSGNPTRDSLAHVLAHLEGGQHASVVSSGMAAITLVCQLLKPEDLLVVPHDCYGGSYRLFTHLAKRGAFRLEVVDQGNAAALDQVMQLQPAMIWIETPSNPLLRIVDISTIIQQAKQCGALTVVDNTFLSPAGQQALKLGADIVVHSTTKYLNGHSDVVGGAVIASDANLGKSLEWWANCLGITGAPFDAWLTLRGVRTLHTRMRVHDENAQKIAGFLENHPAIQHVYYPGLKQHPQHQLAQRQQQLFGGMLSFELANEYSLPALLQALQCFSLAESLGGVESLIAHPATMTHAAMAPEARQRAGISDRLLRVSVGIEHIDDLINDLQQALNTASLKQEVAA